MELILDSCDVTAIRDLCGMLNVAGVTTNPSIIASSGRPVEAVVADLVDLLRPDQKLFIQTLGSDCGSMVKEARRIAALRSGNTYVKIPVTHEGMKAIKACSQEGIGVLATAVFTPEQGLLAAMNGADYIAPYVNRMCNWCDGVAAVGELLAMLRSASLESKVVAASFKNVDQVHKLLLLGIDAVTVPCDIAYRMMAHPGTDEAVEGFDSQWKKAYGRDTLF